VVKEKLKNKFGSKKAQAAFDVIAAGAVLFVLVISAVFILNAPGINPNEQYAAKPLERFSSYQQLIDYIGKANANNYSYGRGIYDIAMPMMATMNATGAAQKSSAESGSGATATDYSKTNIQVEGVDEADIIKNDGKYVYAIAQGKLFIVKAFPAESMKIISTIDLNIDTPQELFISSDSTKLLLFANKGYGHTYDNGYAKRANSYYYGYYGYGGTVVKLFDISNKESPVLEKTIEFNGSYLDSRLIGNNAYFVINSYPRVYYAQAAASTGNDENSIIPLMKINGIESRIASIHEIGIMPRVRPESFVTIASLNLKSQELNKETVLGSANNLYSSQNNIYLADQVWYYNEIDYNGPVPLGGEIGVLVKSIYFPTWNTTEKTVVNKFHLDNGKILFGGQGTAPGHILNQFSMDEHKENFRIATTVGEVWADPSSPNAAKNNVYIFDKDMNLVGALEGLAPAEKIYSARFMGDKGYLVTFKKVDPLFVLDLSNPANPKVLGKLKIPGYSDYLHPIDETHLIGIGKDTIASSSDRFAWYQGLKMAIFDVSDVENPKEMYKVVIGDRGTESEAFNDHKAFLHDKEKQLLVIPVSLAEIPEATKQNKTPEQESQSPTYGEHTFQGAFVFNVSLDKGFVEKGRITHVSSEEEQKSGYYYSSDSQIRRSLFMDNVLYTFSNKMLKANNLSNLSAINEVAFPARVQNNYGEPLPMIK
jgi:uncharacterized secreted protein with C-terminal beta-propeller domain